MEKKRKKKSIRKLPQTRTSVELEGGEDLRARLPVLFEGTKYEEKEENESNDTGKWCSFATDVGCRAIG